MADQTRELQILITARDEASKAINGASGALDNFRDRAKPVIGGLREIGIVAAVAAAGFVAFTAKAAFAGANLERLDKTLEVVAKNAGISKKSLNEMRDSLAEVNTRGSAATETILTFARSGLAANIDFKKFVSTTKDFAAASGVSSDQAIKQFTQSIIRLQPELLSAYGIEFNLSQLYRETAKELGKGVIELTAMEKRQALLNEVQRQGVLVQGAYAETYTTAGKNILSIQDRFRELTEMIGSVLTPAFQQFTNLLNVELTKIVEWFRTNPETVAEWGAKIAVAGQDVINTFRTMVVFLIDNKEIILGVFVALGLGLATLAAAFIAAHAVALAVFAAITVAVTVFAKVYNANFLGIKTVTEAFMNWFSNIGVPTFQKNFNSLKAFTTSLKDVWVSNFNKIKGVIDAVAGAIRSVISAAQELASKVAGGLNIPGLSFQHGGFVPGASNQPVPAILHGGERVVPRTGTDVNSGGGGGPSISISITGDFHLDSDSRVQELADKIIRVLGRQNELASIGVSI